MIIEELYNLFPTLYEAARHIWEAAKYEFSLAVPSFVTNVFPAVPDTIDFTIIGLICGVGFPLFVTFTLAKWLISSIT